MKIFIICSKKFYNRIPDIKASLEAMGHEIVLPNCYDDPSREAYAKSLGQEAHAKFKSEMYGQSKDIIDGADAVLVLNFDKDEVQKNYIGGATFLELYDAFLMGKQIYLYNDIPTGMLYDEIVGFNPTILNGNLNLIKKEIKRVDSNKDYAMMVLLSIKFGIYNSNGIITEDQRKAINEGIDLIFKKNANKEIVTQEEFDKWDDDCYYGGFHTMPFSDELADAMKGLVKQKQD